MSLKSEPYPYSYLCPDCESELNADANRISSRNECDHCGRTRCFDKIKVYYTTVNESGNEKRRKKTVDYQGDTPLLAVNSVLEDHQGPRGERVKEIRRIEVNRTPPLREGDGRGAGDVVFEEAGIVVQDISLRVEK